MRLINNIQSILSTCFIRQRPDFASTDFWLSVTLKKRFDVIVLSRIEEIKPNGRMNYRSNYNPEIEFNCFKNNSTTVSKTEEKR